MFEITKISVEEAKQYYPDAKSGQYLCYLHTLYKDHQGEVINEDVNAVNISNNINNLKPEEYRLEDDEFYTFHILT